MSFNYSGDPSASTLDNVRFLIGDTDIDDPQFQDTEINAILAENASEPYSTAIVLVERLLAKYSRKVDKSMGDLSISYSQMVENYRKLLPQLRMRASIELCAPKLTAMVQDEKKSNEDDASLSKPSFKFGMTDFKSPNNGPVNNSLEE